MLRPRRSAIPADMLPDSIMGMLRAAFEDGAINPGARPTARQWHQALADLEASLQQCRVNTEALPPQNVAEVPVVPARGEPDQHAAGAAARGDADGDAGGPGARASADEDPCPARDRPRPPAGAERADSRHSGRRHNPEASGRGAERGAGDPDRGRSLPGCRDRHPGGVVRCGGASEHAGNGDLQFGELRDVWEQRFGRVIRRLR